MFWDDVGFGQEQRLDLGMEACVLASEENGELIVSPTRLFMGRFQRA
jgi:hypothetical protein